MDEGASKRRRVPLGLTGIRERGAKEDEYIDFGHVADFDEETVTIIQMLALGGAMVMYPREEVIVRHFSHSSLRSSASNILQFVPVTEDSDTEIAFLSTHAFKQQKS